MTPTEELRRELELAAARRAGQHDVADLAVAAAAILREKGGAVNLYCADTLESLAKNVRAGLV